MSTATTFQIKSTSSKETEQIGNKLGQVLHGGEVIEIISDLGGGKTTLSRGIAAGIGSGDQVSSPSFTISNTYPGKQLTMYHFDFYRLHDPGLLSHELKDVLQDINTIVVLEWGDSVRHVLPDDRITIRIEVAGENERVLHITAPKDVQEKLCS